MNAARPDANLDKAKFVLVSEMKLQSLDCKYCDRHSNQEYALDIHLHDPKWTVQTKKIDESRLRLKFRAANYVTDLIASRSNTRYGLRMGHLLGGHSDLLSER